MCNYSAYIAYNVSCHAPFPIRKKKLLINFSIIVTRTSYGIFQANLSRETNELYMMARNTSILIMDTSYVRSFLNSLISLSN